jgi:hypothetical protein
MTSFSIENNPIGSLDGGGRVASTGHGVPVFLLHVLATAQTDQVVGSQVRNGLSPLEGARFEPSVPQ